MTGATGKPSADRVVSSLYLSRTLAFRLSADGLKVSKEELDKNMVDLALRDACAHLLIPLNK
jgi:hypothetical protein